MIPYCHKTGSRSITQVLPQQPLQHFDRDGYTDVHMDRQADSSICPKTFVLRGYNKVFI